LRFADPARGRRPGAPRDDRGTARSLYARRVPSRRQYLSSRRVASLCACALLALAFSGVAAATALSAEEEAGSGAFNELSERAQQPETTPTQTATSTSNEPTSNSKTVVVLALVAAIVLLIAIAAVIVRDARKTAPAGDGPVGEPGSARDSAAMMRKRRAKAKAAGQPRKRNR